MGRRWRKLRSARKSSPAPPRPPRRASTSLEHRSLALPICGRCYPSYLPILPSPCHLCLRLCCALFALISLRFSVAPLSPDQLNMLLSIASIPFHLSLPYPHLSLSKFHLLLCH